MSVHVLLNFLNELREGDKMWGLPSILLLFCNTINKGAYVYVIWHKKFFEITFLVENVKILSSCMLQFYGCYFTTLLRPKI